MPREIITIQCGQCGNQIGHRFWKMALEEHARCNPAMLYDHATSSFFRNVDARYTPPLELSAGEGNRPIFTLKARAVLVDMEEGVMRQISKGPLADLFERKQYITGISGSGNNWAHGYALYGPQYKDAILDKVRHEVELCHSLQSFLLLHSLGGGTGSGVGSFILELLEDEYPKVFRFATSVFPSEDDDVVTSPYNSLLASAALAEHADCVFPIENQSLISILRKNEKKCKTNQSLQSRVKQKQRSRIGNPFDEMNELASAFILHLTSSVRFEGPLNVDLNEVTTNLVPYHRLHFLISSLAPASMSQGKAAEPRTLNQLCNEAFARDNQLIQANPLGSTYLACALLVRGKNCGTSDLSESATSIQQRLKMWIKIQAAHLGQPQWFRSDVAQKRIHWNMQGFKIGICSYPARHAPLSLLCLANNTCVGYSFSKIKSAFQKLYKRRVYVHHYAEYMDPGHFTTSCDTIDDLVAEYLSLESCKPVLNPRFLKPVMTGIQEFG